MATFIENAPEQIVAAAKELLEKGLGRGDLGQHLGPDGGRQHRRHPVLARLPRHDGRRHRDREPGRRRRLGRARPDLGEVPPPGGPDGLRGHRGVHPLARRARHHVRRRPRRTSRAASTSSPSTSAATSAARSTPRAARPTWPSRWSRLWRTAARRSSPTTAWWRSARRWRRRCTTRRWSSARPRSSGAPSSSAASSRCPRRSTRTSPALPLHAVGAMSEGSIRARLAELGLTLHGPHPPHDPLDAVVVHDGVARTSGQLPRIAGELTCLGPPGRHRDGGGGHRGRRRVRAERPRRARGRRSARSTASSGC